MTIAHIICPVDFSISSQRALAQAYAWAHRYQARVRVLHAVVPPPPIVGIGGGVAFLPQPSLDAVRRDLERFVADVPNPGVTVDLDVREGQPDTVIREIADEDTHAMVVMGTQGRTGLDRLLLGSTTERVAHHTRRPLLVVPPQDDSQGSPRTTFTRIVCAVDFRPSSIAALRAAIAFARDTQAALDVVTVLDMLPEVETRGLGHYGDAAYRATRSLELLAQLRSLVPDDVRGACTISERVLTGRPGLEILRCATEREAHLVVMGTGERFHFSSGWLGRTTDRVMRAAHCPVLIVPAPPHMVASDALPLHPEQWAQELDRVTLQHEGHPTTVSILNEVVGAEHEASGLPLVALTVDGRAQERSLAVILGCPDGTHLTHFVVNPTSLRIGEARNHRQIELLITGRDGTTTVVDVGPA